MSSQHPHSSYPQEGSVHQFISGCGSATFEDLARDLFKHQFAKQLPYQRYCRLLGVSPDSVNSWREIPAVPTSAFKLSEHPLSQGETTFLTSGTTTEIKGAHHFPDTNTYDLAALTQWQAHLPELPLYFLSPSPAESPQSSLVHMFGHLDRALNSGNGTSFLLKESRFHLAPLSFLEEPIILAGTALAFLHLCESHQAISLPKGSLILETGGYKGTARTLAKREFYQQLSEFFALPESAIANEYGMTELSSQAYARGPEGSHRFPAWCRYQIISPETGRALPPGEMGYLQLLDLANIHSVAAIRTQDFAIGISDDSFSLIGRDPGALPRGCSRSTDDALSR